MIVRARAPLRLGIAGGGTDVSPYCDLYGGYVLNATIDLYAHTTIESCEDNKIHFEARDYQRRVSINIDDINDATTSECDLALHLGVYRRVVRDYLNGVYPSLRVTTYSDAAAGSGLGTSSTLVVSMLKAFVEYFSLPLGEYEIAHLAYEIERIDVGLQGGKQDQYAATFGGFNYMEFYDNDRVIVNPLRIKNWIVSELESSLVLYFTGISRDSARIISAQVDHLNEKSPVTTSALDSIKEGAVRMKEALLKGELKDFGSWLDSSWQAKKRISEKISNVAVETAYASAKAAGAYAGKVSGAGGGGFMMFLVDPVRRIDVIQALTALQGKVLSCHFVKWGTEGWRIG
jgi:D-glycero-alpha-D-manno-heptose-7-phosphate kinase